MSFDKQPKDFREWNNYQQQLQVGIGQGQLPVSTNFPYIESQGIDAIEIFKSALSSVPVVGGHLSNVVNIVYQMTKTDGSSGLWDSFSVMVKQSIDEAFDKLHSDNMITKLGEIKSHTEQFVEAKRKMNENLDSAQHKQECRTEFNDLEDCVRLALLPESEIRRDDVCFQQLAVFTIIATTHLFILRDIMLNGERWGFTKDLINRRANSYKEVLPQYIKHTKTSYDLGIKKIKGTPNIDGVTKFNRIMNFRSHCARFVFDIIENIWMPLNDKLAGGIYIENVRYIWGEAFGLPRLGNEDAKLEALEYTFEVKELDCYKKELERVSIGHDSKYIKYIQSFYRDEDGGKVGEMVGINVADFESFDFNQKVPVSSSIKGYSAGLPYQIDMNGKQFNPRGNGAKSIITEMYENYKGSRVYMSFVGAVSRFQKPKEYAASFPNHKIACMTGYGINDISPPGGLDCIFTGFLPLNIFKENYLFKSKATMLNAQKYYSKSSDNVKFARDHVLPTVHSMFIPNGESIKFKIHFMQAVPTVTKYSFGIRYHSAKAGKVGLSNPRGEPKDTFDVAACTSVNGFNQYKIARIPGKIDFKNFPNIKPPQITIVAKTDFYLHSFLIFPAQN